jgi:hypothetical protein
VNFLFWKVDKREANLLFGSDVKMEEKVILRLVLSLVLYSVRLIMALSDALIERQ